MRRAVFSLMLALAALSPCLAASGWPSADPAIRDRTLLDLRRPLAVENRTSTADGFTIAVAGDLIIARPLLHARVPQGFQSLVDVLRASDVSFGNLETSLIDIRHFKGGPYPWAGDWANIGLPAVAPDLKAMGFDMVGRANNHVEDWGLDGMRETDIRLDAAGIVHAGTGETAAIARAPQYFESGKGRVALVSFATTFRPTSEAMPPQGEAPGRPGLSAVHLTLREHVTAKAMAHLAAADCAMHQRNCSGTPATLTLDGVSYVRDRNNFNDYTPDSEDLAALARAIREARQHADFVIVAVHAHECAWDCDAADSPQLPAAVLKALARGAIDSGADVFAVTGIHNLGPIEIYRGRPIFYGLANFFWSDIQEPVPYELFQMYRPLLEQAYKHPERATDYDLTAPLNAQSFAHDFTFQSVLAQMTFAHGRLATLKLYPVWLGYGENLRTSGTPRLETDPARAKTIFDAIAKRTAAYGLPALDFHVEGGIAVLRL
jgi:poly-gamma-glutamate synthesis protein (capsule biosynthesis protein)